MQEEAPGEVFLQRTLQASFSASLTNTSKELPGAEQNKELLDIQDELILT